MASKEAIVVVLDTGPSMDQGPYGQDTYLQTSLSALCMILQRKLFAESKDEVALVLFGTTNTANQLAVDGNYKNITLARQLGPVNWELLEYLQRKVHVSNTEADVLDALVVAMDHVLQAISGKKGFTSKRIILFSDLASPFADDKLKDIVGSMKEQKFEVNVIGPSLNVDNGGVDGGDEGGSSHGSNRHSNDHGDGASTSQGRRPQHKPKTPQQRAGEALLRHIIQHTDGASYSFAEALPALSFFQSRQVKMTAWKCPLELAGSVQIPICMYAKMKEAKAKNFKNVYAKNTNAGIERLRTSHLNDEAETEIEKDEVVHGYKYGSSLVPFSEDDKEAMKFKTEKCFKILGFTNSANVKQHQLIGDTTSYVVADSKGDKSAGVALSALINALYETDMVAIVRRVYRANLGVKLGCLRPQIKAKYECLVYNELPFAEDLRQYSFGSLPVHEADVDTKPVNKKLAPTSEQLNIIDNLIDTMDLTKAVRDEDGELEEALKPKLTFNPHLQRLYQSLQHRVLRPKEPLPQLSPVIADYLKPPREVAVRCAGVVEKAKAKFKLTEVVKKDEKEAAEKVFKDKQQAADNQQQAANMAPIASISDLTKPKISEVGTVNPVDDFRAILASQDADYFDEVANMMQRRIAQLVFDSFGSQLYAKALKCVEAFREECVKHAHPKMFNDFMFKLKEDLRSRGRKDFWESLVTARLSLITKVENTTSTAVADDADAFLKEADVVKVVVPKEEPEDADDLLAQL